MRQYGWKKDKHDHRDHLYHLGFGANEITEDLPKSVDLSHLCPPVYDQQTLGSCVANSLSAHFEFCQRKEKISEYMPSRLFLYFNTRVLIEGTDPGEDSGCEIRDGIKSLSNQGLCPDSLWPYDVNKFSEKPPQDCYSNGAGHKAIQYQRLDNSNICALKACLSAGYPFSFGFTVFESFESDEVARTGIMPMPKTNENTLGGHAVLAVGFDDSDKTFLVRNSWGTSWSPNLGTSWDGKKGGYFKMPYEYITNPNLADDFWTLRLVK